MELAFAEKNLRELCEQEAKAVKTYGQAVAARLQSRLADLRANETLGDMAVGRPSAVDGEIHFQLVDGYTLAVSGNQAGPGWKASTRVKIIRISAP